MTSTPLPMSDAERVARWVLFFKTLGATPEWVVGTSMYFHSLELSVCVTATEPQTREEADAIARLGGEDDYGPYAIVWGLPTAEAPALLFCNDSTDGGGGVMWWGFDEPARWRVDGGTLRLIAENGRDSRVLCGPDWKPIPGAGIQPDVSGTDEHVAMAAKMAREAGIYAFPSQR